MGRIEHIGNQADWEGVPLESLEGLNTSRLNAAPLREIDVDAEIMGEDLVVTPMFQKAQAPLRLSEGPDAALNSMLVEEPDEYNPSALAQYCGPRTIAQGDDPKKRNRGSLVWYGIAANYHSAVTGDRVLIEKDGVESEWACRTCKGKGHTDEPCTVCRGSVTDGGGACTHCRVIGFGIETVHSSGHRVCDDCCARGIGTGWRGRVVIPEKSQDIPMTGHVVSVGPQTLLAQLGDRVLFSKYAGHNVQNEHGSFQIMRESEILMLIKEKQ